MRISNKLSIITTGAAVITSCLIAGQAHAVSFTFTKIVDTNTPFPGGTGNFHFFGVPAFDNGNIAFIGIGSGRQKGIYTYTGNSLNVVADTNTMIPERNEKFQDFLSPSLSGSNVVFSGSGSESQSLQGIYSNFGGSLNVVVNKTTAIPGEDSNFADFSEYSVENENVAFLGYNSQGQTGIYTKVGKSLNKIVNQNTPIPGGIGNFRNYGPPSLNSGNVAFSGFGFKGEQGIYSSIGASVNVVADTSTPIPGGTGNFKSFDTLISLENENVAFLGFGSNEQTGIYTNIDGSVNVVADTNTPIPGGTGNFKYFANPSIDSKNVVFRGFGSGFGSEQHSGIYTNIGGSLMKVIDRNDFLDNKSLSFFLDFGAEGLSGNSLAFGVIFADGSPAIFRADAIFDNSQSVPEPTGTLGILALGVLSFCSALKHKQES